MTRTHAIAQLLPFHRSLIDLDPSALIWDWMLLLVLRFVVVLAQQ